MSSVFLHPLPSPAMLRERVLRRARRRRRLLAAMHAVVTAACATVIGGIVVCAGIGALRLIAEFAL